MGQLSGTLLILPARPCGGGVSRKADGGATVTIPQAPNSLQSCQGNPTLNYRAEGQLPSIITVSMLADIHAPLGSCLPCILWFVMPGWIVMLVHKMIMTELDPLTGILAVMMAVWLGFLAWNPPAPWVEPVAILSVFAMMVGIPIAQKMLEKYSDKELENEQIDNLYEQLRGNPQNSIALFRLARFCYQKGMAGHGIVLAQNALTTMPQNLFRDEHKEFVGWVAAFGTKQPVPVPCLSCNRTCHPGQIYCQHCWSPFLAQYLKGKSGSHASIVRRVVVVWVALMVVVFAIPSLGMFGPVVVIPIVVAVLGLCAWALFSAFTDVVRTA